MLDLNTRPCLHPFAQKQCRTGHARIVHHACKNRTPFPSVGDQLVRYNVEVQERNMDHAVSVSMPCASVGIVENRAPINTKPGETDFWYSLNFFRSQNIGASNCRGKLTNGGRITGLALPRTFMAPEGMTRSKATDRVTD